MAKLGSQLARVYFAGFDLGTATTGFTLDLNLEALDPTTIADNAERALAGIRHDSLEWSGIFDDATASDAAGSAMIGSSTNNAFSLHVGTGIGSRAYAGPAICFAGKSVLSVKELVMQELTFIPDGSFQVGKTQLLKTTISGSSSSGSIDHAASAGTATYQWFLHVFDYAGGGTTVVTLQDSADGITFVGLGSVGAINTRNSFISSASGTVRRYTRIIKNATGTASLAVVLVAV